MRDVLLSWTSADGLEEIGFWILIVGLAGEIGILFISHERTRLIKALTTICVVAIIAGIWLEHVGAEANKAPRRLNAAQRAVITEKVKPFPKIPFVLMSANAAEPLDFALDIASALKDIGWDWKPFPPSAIGVTPSGDRSRVGFSVLAHLEVQARTPELKDAAAALESAFRAIGAQDVRRVSSDTEPSDPNAKVIYVIVGSKK